MIWILGEMMTVRRIVKEGKSVEKKEINAKIDFVAVNA